MHKVENEQKTLLSITNKKLRWVLVI